jgi:Concanavalin A-like lectin/glucanases superfamily
MAVYVGGGSFANTNVNSSGQFNKTIATTFGLQAYWDSAITASWVNGSSTLYDLSGNGNNLGAYGTPVAQTVGGATAWNFTAQGQYFYTSSSATTGPSKNATIEAWIYPASSEIVSGDRGTILLWNGNSGIYHSWNKSNQQLSNYWYTHPTTGYWETVSAMTRSTWNYTAAVWNYNSNCIFQYTNLNSGQGNPTVGNSNAGNYIYIGLETGSPTRQFSGGIALIRVWSRALMPHEIYNNYLAEKGRFGL